MQDNATPHASAATRAAIKAAGVTKIFWPAYSPDLNLIKSLWDVIKNWIADNYVIKDLKNYKVLRKAVTKAWASIGKAQLDDLINSMHDRCEAVIAADGKQTKY